MLIEARPLRLDVWHDEPGGHDAFEVCGHPPTSITARLAWTFRHGRHLHYRWWPYLNVRRWIVDRCDGCGKRFRWREARHSYQSTDKVWHDVCMSLRHVRSQLDDITAYVRAEADSNARWRVEYRLKHLDEAAQP
ncbi:hypothetical protein [Micromonospora sp. A200]|uniref:hypothetical protein n=1 Tax=Micromonospora sp. A200 TaxID=2940568 RepID=UPI0024767F20|nr:hypothetical protein [Micromonospora sp. A200]